ncbi:Ger(x)C family spore germination C-terminal domain-containing protein [Paenibacillus sp. LHD-117]|uniref:Ger(x)C family spore germination C-terminal domain-containing protein n=1 Tax=Paenibacillus sp. LHD-117 TaxID=3071412 RepID=UPI0035A95402
MEQLRAELSNALQKQAAQVAGKIKAARCDALGIGRRVRVSHPKLWKDSDWRDSEWKSVYPKIRITTEFQIDFVSSGILN